MKVTVVGTGTASLRLRRRQSCIFRDGGRDARLRPRLPGGPWYETRWHLPIESQQGVRSCVEDMTRNLSKPVLSLPRFSRHIEKSEDCAACPGYDSLPTEMAPLSLQTRCQA